MAKTMVIYIELFHVFARQKLSKLAYVLHSYLKITCGSFFETRCGD